ncbi:hypothetical protein WJX79_000287 [Trebouxia sp. C0005]
MAFSSGTSAHCRYTSQRAAPLSRGDQICQGQAVRTNSKPVRTIPLEAAIRRLGIAQSVATSGVQQLVVE